MIVWTLSRARSLICSADLLAMGWLMTTTGCSGRPKALARNSAALVNAFVMTVTAGTPRFSDSIPSWRPHAVQEPQSATAWMMAWHWEARSSNTSSGDGMLWLAFL